MADILNCPTCGAPGMEPIYELAGVPVHSVSLLTSPVAARQVRTGDIRLAWCPHCGFISNMSYDARLQDYSDHYESTQKYSPTFDGFQTRLAETLVERYGLLGKTVVEIGCGQGEFLTLLCCHGAQRGIGFDPAYVGGTGGDERVQVIPDYYSDRYSWVRGDFFCCKMTLEHIHDTAGFVGTVRRAIGDQPQARVFFQVPDVTRILREAAFWDIYYEHCSYFSAGSLACLFERCGFEVIDVRTEYDGQYLMVEARPAGEMGRFTPPADLETVRADVERFRLHVQAAIAGWRDRLEGMKAAGRRVVLWGGGSKAVAFLTTLKVGDAVAAAVDINPKKHGTFLAGTAHRVVGPQDLTAIRPDVVVVMNPIYLKEIAAELHRLGLSADLLPVTE